MSQLKKPSISNFPSDGDAPSGEAQRTIPVVASIQWVISPENDLIQPMANLWFFWGIAYLVPPPPEKKNGKIKLQELPFMVCKGWMSYVFCWIAIHPDVP